MKKLNRQFGYFQARFCFLAILLTILSLKMQAQCISPPAPIPLYEGQAYRISADAGYTNYQWYLDNGTGSVAIAGATSRTYDVTLNGKYTYTADDPVTACPASNCCAVEFYLACTPIIGLTANPSSNDIAQGFITVLNANATTGIGTNTTFNWTGGLSGSPNSFTSTVQNPTTGVLNTLGSYNYTVTARNIFGTATCTATASTSLIVRTATCNVNIISATPSACDKWSNTYDVAVRLNYTLETMSTININGQIFTPNGLSGTETFKIGRFTSNGATNLPISVNVSGMTCTATMNYNAPANCRSGIADPIGYIYCEQTGQIITGGTVSITPPAGGAVTIVENGSTGRYQWFTNGVSGIYTMTYTPPAGYSLSTTCLPQMGVLDPTGMPDPYRVGSAATGMQLNTYTCASNVYYTSFNLNAGDPIVDQNNFPLICPCPSVTTIATPVTCDGNVARIDAKVTLSNLLNVTHYRYSTVSHAGLTFAGATPIAPTGGDIVTGIANPAIASPINYYIRVFNNNECYRDYTVTINHRVCSCTPAICLDMVSVKIR